MGTYYTQYLSDLMIVDLLSEPNLKGYVMEYACRILLRRAHKNNFIFMTWRFQSFSEIAEKYRLDCSQIPDLVDYLNSHNIKCDLVEIHLNNVTDRKVTGISFYDVKTRWHSLPRDYFEACKLNHLFMQEMQFTFGQNCYIISSTIFDNWKFSFNIISYQNQKIRIYKKDRIKTKKES